jgi:hypothetical protein
LEQQLQILKTMADVSRIAVAPEQNGTISRCFNVPSEQADSISSVKPDLLQR